MERTGNLGKLLVRIMAVALLMIAGFGSVRIYAESTRRAVDYQTFKDGKYIIEQTASGEIVYDKNGNVLISPGRYCRIDYLGKNIFAVYKIQDGNSDMMTSTEMFSPYLLNLAKGTEKKVQLSEGHEDVDAQLFPFSNGYAKVKNGAYYAWTPLDYYFFVDKNGKRLMNEQPYSWCSDMLKVDGKLTFFTKGDELSFSSGADKDSLRRITKRDSSGKALKDIVLAEGYGYEDIRIIKKGKKFFIWIEAQSSEGSEYLLYDMNLNQVKKSQAKIKAMVSKTYDPVGKRIEMTASDSYFASTENGVSIPGRNWMIINPAATLATSFDVSGCSKDEDAWVMLYTTAAEKDSWFGENHWILDGSANNQAFIFEPVGKDSDGNMKCRIWAAHSGRQLKSSLNKDDNVTRLVQGSFTDKDSKNKVIGEQIFTLKENADGTFCILNCDGKYLTMAYGSTESGTQLVFADYANGDSKQLFKGQSLSSGLNR